MVRRCHGWGLVFCGFAFVGDASALTTSEFEQSPEAQQLGYVFGIMEYSAKVASQGDEKAITRSSGYSNCFLENKITAREGLKIVRRYIDRTPDASTQPMLGNVLQALYQACKRYLSE